MLAVILGLLGYGQGGLARFEQLDLDLCTRVTLAPFNDIGLPCCP